MWSPLTFPPASLTGVKARQGRRQRVSGKGTSGIRGTADPSAAFLGALTSIPTHATRVPMPPVYPRASALPIAFEPTQMNTCARTHQAHTKQISSDFCVRALSKTRSPNPQCQTLRRVSVQVTSPKQPMISFSVALRAAARKDSRSPFE